MESLNPQLENTLVERRMTFTPGTVAPSDSVAHARALLDEYGISHLPVLDHGRLIGMLTARDLGGRPGARLSRKIARALLWSPQGVAVRKVMRTGVYTVKPSDSLRQAARLMTRGRIRALPVVEQGKLRGIISSIDLAFNDPGRRSA